MAIKYIKHSLLYLILILLLRDSFFKLYKGTTHRFIYPDNKEIANTSMEKWILEGREEVISLNNRLLGLNKETKHFHRIFIPQNHYLYLSGILQQYKIYEATIYESSISKELQDFYDYVVLRKNSLASKELKYAMPYFLFTRHVHSGLNLGHTEIPYNDFFMFSPADIKKLQKQNIEFLWDVMQIKYLIIESELSAAIENFAALDHGNKLLIIGDMFELGEYANIEHKKIVDLVVEKKLNDVILIGPEFTKANSGKHRSFLNTQDCLTDLKSNPQKNKMILIKGSRGMKLEILKEAL